jgi:hypothetical protein
LFGRNLTLLGEWLSILFKRNLSQKELNTSGGVVKHPKNIKEEYFKRNLTLLGEWLSILFKRKLFGRNLTLLEEWLSILKISRWSTPNGT